MEVSEEVRVLLEKRVPKKCPFCWAADSTIAWSEFSVVIGEPFYADRSSGDVVLFKAMREPVITVRCTRCDEDIREEDVDGKLL